MFIIFIYHPLSFDVTLLVVQYNARLLWVGQFVTSLYAEFDYITRSGFIRKYFAQSTNGNGLRGGCIGIVFTRSFSHQCIGIGAGITTKILWYVALLAGISRVRKYPPTAHTILGHVAHADLLPIHFLCHGKFGVWRTDGIVFRENDIHQRRRIIMILALVLQRTVESQEQTAILVLSIRRIVDMRLNLLLCEGTAPNGKIIDQCFLFIAICRSSSDDDRIIAYCYLALLGVCTHKHTIDIEIEVILFLFRVIGQGYMVPITVVFYLIAPAIPYLFPFSINRILRTQACIEVIPVTILTCMNIPATIV